MQTTLLGIAIALILALLAALIGPHFVHWNDHRAFFEAEASRLVGLQGPGRRRHRRQAPAVSVGDARAASPSARPARRSRLRARSLRIELALGRADARRASRHRDEARRAAVQPRPRRAGPDRLAAAGARDRDAVDRPADASRTASATLTDAASGVAAGARSGVVHRRGALADRSDPRRGRVRRRRRALRLRDLGRAERRRTARGCASA